MMRRLLGSPGRLVRVALVLFVVGGTARANPLAPEMLDVADPAWDDLLRLELSGAIPAGTTSMRPVSRGEIAAWIAGAAHDPRAERSSLERLQRSFARELRRLGHDPAFRETPSLIRLAGEDAPEDRAIDGARSELRLGPTLGLQIRGGDGTVEFGDSTRAGLYGVLLIGRNAAVQGELFVGEIEGGRRIGDPLIHGTDILYFSEDMGASIATKVLRLRLARGRHHWGPGAGASLLLDRHAAPISFFEWDLAMPAGIRWRSWVGSLNISEHRGIAAHRLEIPLRENLRVAIAEGVRYSGGPEHPLYLLGLLPYTLVQRLDEQDTLVDSLRFRQRNNVLAELETVWRIRPGLLTYAEILIDDLPAETADNPARLGARLGLAMMFDRGGRPVDLRLEGTKVGRYTYAVDYPGIDDADWIHQDRALGEPGGPDQEALRLWIGRSLTRDHYVQLQGVYANHGGGALGEAWQGASDDSSERTRDVLKVSPPVARQRCAMLRWRWTPRDNLFVDSQAGVERLRAVDGQGEAHTDTTFLFGMRLGWRY